MQLEIREHCMLWKLCWAQLYLCKPAAHEAWLHSVPQPSSYTQPLPYGSQQLGRTL